MEVKGAVWIDGYLSILGLHFTAKAYLIYG
jgi:hypothetical protein